jgi:hypothetical protein
MIKGAKILKKKTKNRRDIKSTMLIYNKNEMIYNL